MSFDDYANHIYQKHRLAVALAVIKSTPENVPTSEYLEQLKSKFNDKMDEDDITLCSDDFLIDDADDDMNDSINILKDFDPGNLNDDNLEMENGDDNIADVCKVPQYLTQTTYYEGLQSQSTPIPDRINKDTATFTDLNNLNKNHLLDDTIPRNIASNEESKLKIHYNRDNISNENNKESVRNTDCFYDSQKTVINNKESVRDTNSTYYDSQKTVLYTVPGFDNYTHYSASQTDIIIPNKYIYGVNRAKNLGSGIINVNKENDKYNDSQNTNVSTRNYLRNESQNVETDDRTHENTQIDVNFEYSQTMNMFAQKNDDFNQLQHSLINDDIPSNDTSKNDRNAIENTASRQTDTNNPIITCSQNIDEYFEEMQNIIEIDIPNETSKSREHTRYELSDIDLTYDSQNINEFNRDITMQYHKNYTNEHSNNLTQNSETIQSKSFNKNIDFENKEDIEEENDYQEIISYKVLEEFNKVKTFLNRERRLSCDGYSTDSGYRSDSQIRSSNRSALQLSGNWLSQSGCCLYNYIMQCPLVDATRDITQEIAQVLSELINKLHEQEKYPSFLEDLLESVDILLRQLYEGQSCDSEFLKKDEYIQRILLLNKSVHIQKHTIEKISKILENFHSKITETESTVELTNIDEIENVTYIFHVLEILLKKYLKNKEIFSQCTQSQDDEKIFKKSSITDIWRKKWNPEQKVFEGTREKTCVLKLCSEILNKIVVNCVNSYSLVAYSALKCFNSMQS